MGNEKKNNTLGKALAIIGGVTILGLGGVSIFGGFSIFQSLVNELKVIVPSGTQENPKQNSTPSVTVSPTEAPKPETTDTPTQESQNSAQSASVITREKSTKELTTKVVNEIREHQVPVTTISPNENNQSEDSDTNDNTGQNSETTKYAINVDSQGQLLMMSKNSGNLEGDVKVSYKEDESTDSEQAVVSYDSSDIVNDGTATSSQYLNYLNVTPGIYIFETTYNIGEINFYILDDINNLSSLSEAEEDYEEIVVPTEEMTIEITEENPSKLFKATSQDDFVPILNFFSSDGTESNLVMKILDEGKSELQTVDLNHIGIDGTNDVIGTFSFESEKIFYIEISAEDEITTPQTCYFSITKSAEEYSTDSTEE